MVTEDAARILAASAVVLGARALFGASGARRVGQRAYSRKYFLPLTADAFALANRV